MTKLTPAQKALSVLRENLNIHDLKELIGLLEVEVEEQVKKDMVDQL